MRGLRAGLALAAVVYLGMVVAADGPRLAAALARVPLTTLLACLLVVLLGFALRAWKFHAYLAALGVEVEPRASLRIFLAGMSMGITPGKLGEVLKSFLLRDELGVAVARTAPTVLFERVTDLLSMLALIALAGGGQGPGLVEAVSLGLAVGLLVVLGVPGPFLAALRWLPEAAAPLVAVLEQALTSGRELVRPWLTIWTSAISVVAWGLEALALTWIMGALGTELSAGVACRTYAFASLAGAVTMLPGGLGATEASMTVMLEGAGAARPEAAAATLLLRLTTLWFGVLCGVLALAASGGVARGLALVEGQEEGGAACGGA